MQASCTAALSRRPQEPAAPAAGSRRCTSLPAAPWAARPPVPSKPEPASPCSSLAAPSEPPPARSRAWAAPAACFAARSPCAAPGRPADQRRRRRAGAGRLHASPRCRTTGRAGLCPQSHAQGARTSALEPRASAWSLGEHPHSGRLPAWRGFATRRPPASHCLACRCGHCRSSRLDASLPHLPLGSHLDAFLPRLPMGSLLPDQPRTPCSHLGCSAIPVRFKPGVEGPEGVEVLLISSRRGKGYVFPKVGGKGCCCWLLLLYSVAVRHVGAARARRGGWCQHQAGRCSRPWHGFPAHRHAPDCTYLRLLRPCRVGGRMTRSCGTRPCAKLWKRRACAASWRCASEAGPWGRDRGCC